MVLINGGASGADLQAREWAKRAGVPVELYQADWEALGRAAGPMRNQRVLEEGKRDLVIGHTNDLSRSKGTAHMAKIAREAGVMTWVLGSE